MSLKRLWGVLLGVITGIVPFVNTVAAIIMAYKLKKKRWVAIYGIISGVTLGIIVLLNVSAHREKPVRTAFPAAFEKNLQTVAVKQDIMMDSVEMESNLQQVLKNTAAELIAQDPKNKPLLAAAQQGRLTGKAGAAFHQLSQCLYGHYLNKVKAATGKGKYDLTFDMEVLATDHQVEDYIRNFIGEYLTAPHGLTDDIASGLALIGYIIAAVGCISNGANLFTGPARVSNDNNAGVAKDTMGQSFNRQPSREPVVSPASFQPPPLPQESTATFIVNVNTSGEEELMQLRGINRILAKTIISERKTGGNFTDINDLKKRMELSSEQVDRIRGNVNFDAPKRGGGRVIEF
ncbi:helix-hairpin-helix domain-containing protein [Chitinophaga sp.]|uniref:ComEA family DNA-binding protein n=1 Tax=Chitinophaga sp. TaxID=1869181 RepID=UPI0031E26D6D